MDTDQALILIRGLPGSGKSTMARRLIKYGFIHVEADQYFMKGEEYRFDPTRLKDAHNYSMARTTQLLIEGHSVVVSNTFTRLWEMEFYAKLAKRLGVRFQVFEATGTWKNVHDVPEHVLDDMRNRWEELSDEFLDTYY